MASWPHWNQTEYTKQINKDRQTDRANPIGWARCKNNWRKASDPQQDVTIDNFKVARRKNIPPSRPAIKQSTRHHMGTWTRSKVITQTPSIPPSLPLSLLSSSFSSPLPSKVQLTPLYLPQFFFSLSFSCTIFAPLASNPWVRIPPQLPHICNALASILIESIVQPAINEKRITSKCARPQSTWLFPVPGGSSSPCFKDSLGNSLSICKRAPNKDQHYHINLPKSHQPPTSVNNQESVQVELLWNVHVTASFNYLYRRFFIARLERISWNLFYSLPSKRIVKGG